MRRIAIIFNQKSGVSDKLTEIKEYYAKLPEDEYFVETTIIDDGNEIHDVARTYARGEWDVIVAAGGDGTISVVAEVLMGSGHTLGVLPLGTLNHFAKDMNIPLELTSALELVSRGRRVVRVDVGKCNDAVFINNSSMGIYPKVVALREHFQEGGERKWFAFISATRRVIGRIPKITVMLDIDGKRMLRTTSFIFVGNNSYKLEGLNIGSRTTLSSGRLSLWVSRNTTASGLLLLGLRMIFGKTSEDRDFAAFHPTEVEVGTKEKNVLVSLDGEVAQMKSPLRYTIVPSSLSILVPELS